MAFFEENRATDIPLEQVIDALRLFFSDINNRDIKFFYHGTYNVFEVKNRYIFRFPDILFRNDKGVKLIQNEVNTLYYVEKYISTTIPEPEFISLDPDCPFMGYEKIEGVPLSKCFHNASIEEKSKIALEIGGFLSELHNEKLVQDALKNLIIDDRFTCEKYREDWQIYFENVQKIIFKLMNPVQKKWIVNFFNTFLNNNENFNFKGKFIHGDFDISNIIINPKTFKLNGIVDFEESRIYDPAADFLFFDEGNAFLKTIIENYREIMEISFEERMKFLYCRSCLGYIEFGIENKIPEMVNAGFKLLNRKMSRFPLK
ncbi:MAG: phosphotransferase family protein [Promethearchaeota archaeon]